MASLRGREGQAERRCHVEPRPPPSVQCRGRSLNGKPEIANDRPCTNNSTQWDFLNGKKHVGEQCFAEAFSHTTSFLHVGTDQTTRYGRGWRSRFSSPCFVHPAPHPSQLTGTMQERQYLPCQIAVPAMACIRTDGRRSPVSKQSETPASRDV